MKSELLAGEQVMLKCVHHPDGWNEVTEGYYRIDQVGEYLNLWIRDTKDGNPRMMVSNPQSAVITLHIPVVIFPGVAWKFEDTRKSEPLNGRIELHNELSWPGEGEE